MSFANFETNKDMYKSIIAGTVATVPMTALMSYLHKQLPAEERYPLPPRQITMKVADEVGLKNKMSEDQKFFVTMGSHFLYGGLGGAMFFPLIHKWHVSNLLGGVSFGLFVWGASYGGWLPVAGLHKSAAKSPVKRSLLMIAAHVVWGASLGIVFDQLTDKKKLPGFAKGINRA